MLLQKWYKFFINMSKIHYQLFVIKVGLGKTKIHNFNQHLLLER